MEIAQPSQVTILPIYVDEERLALKLPADAPIYHLIRKIKGVKWSSSLGCWHLPLTREHYNSLVAVTEGIIQVDNYLLKQYLEQRKIEVIRIKGSKITRRKFDLLVRFPLCKENLGAYGKFIAGTFVFVMVSQKA